MCVCLHVQLAGFIIWDRMMTNVFNSSALNVVPHCVPVLDTVHSKKLKFITKVKSEFLDKIILKKVKHMCTYKFLFIRKCFDLCSFFSLFVLNFFTETRMANL